MDIFLYISKQQSFFPVFVHCLDWGLGRAHQPAKRTDKINCFCVSVAILFWLSFVLVLVSSLSISVSPHLVNTDLSRSLCFFYHHLFSQTYFRHIPASEVFHSYCFTQKENCLLCSCLFVCASICISNKHTHIQYVAMLYPITEKRREDEWKL